MSEKTEQQIEDTKQMVSEMRAEREALIQECHVTMRDVNVLAMTSGACNMEIASVDFEMVNDKPRVTRFSLIHK